jgi:hypothetical protein
MATSGTATFDLDLVEMVEEAYERAGSQMRTGYDMRTARRSLNLLFADWANRGINMWTIEQGEIALIPETATYDLPADTVDLLEHVLRTGSGSDAMDTTLSRTSVPTYATIPNKGLTGTPSMVLVTRGRARPTVTLWPVPASTGTSLAYWRLRRIQDAGAGGTRTMDVPFRMLPPLVAGLAYYLALKVPGGMERRDALKAEYDEAWIAAADEDREKASTMLVPGLS